jgi:N-succinyldiaminopimelate aminotransferase
VHAPQGGYFTVADARDLGGEDAAAFCRALPERAGVVAIPLTAFVSEAHRNEYAGLVRFAACKRVDVLEEAAARLARFSA